MLSFLEKWLILDVNYTKLWDVLMAGKTFLGVSTIVCPEEITTGIVRQRKLAFTNTCGHC
jgi:hypothetical protein